MTDYPTDVLGIAANLIAQGWSDVFEATGFDAAENLAAAAARRAELGEAGYSYTTQAFMPVDELFDMTGYRHTPRILGCRLWRRPVRA